MRLHQRDREMSDRKTFGHLQGSGTGLLGAHPPKPFSSLSAMDFPKWLSPVTGPTHWFIGHSMGQQGSHMDTLV